MSDVTAQKTTPGRGPGPEVEAQRDQLREAMIALEQALAQPSSGRRDAWRAELGQAVVGLREAVERHHDVTEGADGLLNQIVSAAPHLEHAAGAVRAEHDGIDEHLRRLVDGIDALGAATPADASALDTVRDLGSELLGLLVRHRQRGVELTYQAFASDLGSGD